MQGNVLKRWIPKFEKLLQENATFLIEKPTLGSNLANYKYVDNPHKLSLHYTTKVTKCKDFTGPVYGFSFTNYQSILDKAIPETLTIGKCIICFFKSNNILFYQTSISKIIKLYTNIFFCILYRCYW